MSRLFYHVMQDNAGNLLFNVSGTMRLAGTGTAATIYGDEALTIPIANPMTNHPSFGSFKCYLGASAAGYDFYMAKAGYTFETLTGVQGAGTMAQQNANAVAITGGSAVLTSGCQVQCGMGVSRPEASQTVVTLSYNRALSQSALNIRAVGNDIGAYALLFNNVAGAQIGDIYCSATTTSYTTTSDSRLKHAITPLTGALDVVQALRPVSFLWKADGTPGRGFLAQEVAAVVDGVITGEDGAVDEAGGIVPQMIDYSKLVPFLVGAIQTLTARVAVLEDALGV